MRLLGTSPAPSSRFPHPPPFFPYLSSCPPVFLGHFFGFFSAAGPARRGQIQSDLAMVCLGWLNNGPSSGSLLVLALRLSTRMLPCWSTLDFYIITTHLQPMVILTPDPFLVRASRLLYENMAYRWWISWTSFASLLQCNSRRERRPLATTPRFPSSVPSSRLASGSRDTNLAFTLFSSSTSESVGQLSSPQPVLVIVAGSFACLSSPCAPLPVSSLPCLSSDTVWLVLWLATVLQGPCQ